MAVKIDNWFPMADGMAGKITGHPRQSDFSTDMQITSPIKLTGKEKEGDTVVSKSGTVYILGTPFKKV